MNKMFQVIRLIVALPFLIVGSLYFLGCAILGDDIITKGLWYADYGSRGIKRI